MFNGVIDLEFSSNTFSLHRRILGLVWQLLANYLSMTVTSFADNLLWMVMLLLMLPPFHSRTLVRHLSMPFSHTKICQYIAVDQRLQSPINQYIQPYPTLQHGNHWYYHVTAHCFCRQWRKLSFYLACMQRSVLRRPFCLSIRLSVCLSNACIVTKRRILCPHSYTACIEDRIVLTKRMVGRGDPLSILPEILGQTGPVGVKTPIFNRYLLVAPQS